MNLLEALTTLSEGYERLLDMEHPLEVMGSDMVATLIAKHARDAIEQFHCQVDGMTDEVMAEINKAQRRAIYEVLEALNGESVHGIPAHQALASITLGVPDYWEKPSTLVEPK